jgi:hypothetical protein
MLDGSIFTSSLLKVSSVALAGYVRASRSPGGKAPLKHMLFVAFDYEVLVH